jgi:geranylgeranylglyceryl phosphate synthase family protein
MIGGTDRITKKNVTQTVEFLRSLTDADIYLIVPNQDCIISNVDGVFAYKVYNTRNAFFRDKLQARLLETASNIGLKVWKVGLLVFNPGQRFGRTTDAILLNKNDTQEIKGYIDIIENDGIKNLYIETGSGSRKILDKEPLNYIRKRFSGSIFYGGGISSAKDISTLFKIGLDYQIIGTLFEQSSPKTSIAELDKVYQKLFNQQGKGETLAKRALATNLKFY